MPNCVWNVNPKKKLQAHKNLLKKNLLALGFSGLIVFIDQISKMLIKYAMNTNQVIPVIGNFIRLRLIMNPGMAFGFQIGGRMFFIIFTSIASIVILIFLFRIKEEQTWTRVAFSSILGGAIGNLIDRVTVGKVIDFVEIGPWPIFNFADVAVSFGMILLILTILFEKKDAQEISY